MHLEKNLNYSLSFRAERLHINSERLQVIADTDFDHILEQADAMTPSLLVIDSIQTMYTGDIDAAPGSVSQVRECTSRLLRFCKERNIPTVIIGHATKGRQYCRASYVRTYGGCSALL